MVVALFYGRSIATAGVLERGGSNESSRSVPGPGDPACLGGELASVLPGGGHSGRARRRAAGAKRDTGFGASHAHLGGDNLFVRAVHRGESDAGSRGRRRSRV